MPNLLRALNLRCQPFRSRADFSTDLGDVLPTVFNQGHRGLVSNPDPVLGSRLSFKSDPRSFVLNLIKDRSNQPLGPVLGFGEVSPGLPLSGGNSPRAQVNGATIGLTHLDSPNLAPLNCPLSPMLRFNPVLLGLAGRILDHPIEVPRSRIEAVQDFL